jgi:hypothetical protein
MGRGVREARPVLGCFVVNPFSGLKPSAVAAEWAVNSFFTRYRKSCTFPWTRIIIRTLGTKKKEFSSGTEKLVKIS